MRAHLPGTALTTWRVKCCVCACAAAAMLDGFIFMTDGFKWVDDVVSMYSEGLVEPARKDVWQEG